MGDFNMDLLKTENEEKIGDYYDIWSSHLFAPHITLPTRITSRSKTLIDNIFSNDPNFANSIKGNFTFSISYHLPQYIQKIRDFNREELVADFLGKNWIEVISPNKMDSNYSFDNFIDTVNSF